MIGKRAAVERGTYLGEFPYVRFGRGPENLVILPGITLENEPPNRIAAWTYRFGFGRFARAYTVHVINRQNSCGTRPGGTQLEVGEMQRGSKSVDPQNVRSARAKLEIGACQ